jgi:3-oxoacyl-[acyl-carrier protein] reductase
VSERCLQGRNALITGASRGIGRATALSMARSGANVAIAYSTQAEAARATVEETSACGVNAVALAVDLADPGRAAAVVEDAAAALGGVDILVNNAGITRDGLAVRMRDADWDAVINVDLSAAFRVSRAALKMMLRNRFGRIVNVSSVSGVSGNAGQANYAAAKAGVIGLTKSLAREVATRGITVNAVAPGFIATEMTAQLTDAQRSSALAAVPAERFGTPEEVAAAICFLASPQASYITGTVVHVDGGLGA